MLDETRLVLQLAIGLVFLLSACGKLLNPHGFARGVMDYQVLPNSLAYGVGLVLIPVEVLLAVSHLSGWLLAFAVPLALAILASFAAAVAVNLRRRRVLPCYCFGDHGGETISRRSLIRLLLLVAGELLLLANPTLFATSQLVYPHRLAGFSDLGLVLFWAIFLLVAGLWFLSIADVMEVLRPAGLDSRSGLPPPDTPS